ncbi:MAG: SUMF1/EgtB/PvdO family nonheme iron enzyme [Rikenellaceae bacterium]
MNILRRIVLCAVVLSQMVLGYGVQAQNLPKDLFRSKEELKRDHVEFRSVVKRKGESAEKISVDVSGWQTLSLRSWGTEDGISYDQSAWANAYLVKGDGTKVRLSDMKFLYGNTRYGAPKRNIGFSEGPIVINGELFEHGVAMHAEAEIVVDIAGEYTTLEAEVGIEDSGSPASSVIFIVQNMSARSKSEELFARYPTQMGAMVALGRADLEAWMNSGNDASYERDAALTAVKTLRDGAAYSAKIAAVEGGVEHRIAAYVDIVCQVERINDLNNRLKFVDVKSVRRAFDDMKKVAGYDVECYESKMKQLESAEPFDLYSGDDADLVAAESFLSLAREILLSNKALDNDRIILSRYSLGSQGRSATAPLLGTQANNWTNQMSAVRVGFDAQIAQMSNLRGEKPHFETIYKPEIAAPLTDLMLHWDGDRILFTSINDDTLWDIFEVGVDGEGLREVIDVDEPDLEFFDATFLPNGKFIANSNIGYQGVPCVHGTAPVGNMVLFDPKDGSMRRLTFDQDANWHPVVANNGKVMYVRWEYTDLTHYFSRITMHMNPDGTEQKALYGSGGFFPNSTFDIQPLPGNTSKFIGVISGHHGVARSGRLMLFDPAKSRKKSEGIAQEIPFSTRPIDPIIRDGLVNGVWPQFLKPHPVTDKYFLVTAKLSDKSLWGVYLVDIYDNMTLIAECEGEGLINAIYLQKRDTPPAIPDKVDLSSTQASVYIQDIYEGEGLPGVPRGTVKKLRVFAYEYAYVRSPSNHIAQGIQSGWDIKRLLGEVDVNVDGSTIFEIPANTPVSLQPLDSLGQAMQWMRSWFTAMPGEVVSCVGCHEDQNTIALPKRSEASQQSPQPIVAWEGGVRPFTYELEVQPVLDRACVGCHNSNSQLLNFEGGIADDGGGFPDLELQFSKSYLNLHPFVSRQGPEADALVMKPYEYHASTSELIRILRNGHHGVELADAQWRTLYAWIDLNAPYHSAFVQNDLGGYNQIDRRRELSMCYNNIDVDWLQEIENRAKYLESKGAIEAVVPDYEAPTYREAKAKGWPFDATEAEAMQQALGESRKEIDLGEGVKMVFRLVPAGQFVMGSNEGGAESAPQCRVKIDKPFWMGEIEVTNQQYNALVPDHDSRYMAQFWKDHTGPGYEANRPNQPVIRVSYDQMEAFCEALSAKVGLSVKLPTEAQWEWAARAGSQEAFWFGAVDADFGAYENMADVQLEKMAVSGVNPRPMSKSGALFKYYNYLPKSEEVDDGEMIQAEVGRYKPNPWGLYDMLGNVREMTSSDYIPYPYKREVSTAHVDKVVRGGSWIDRAKFSTSYSRKSVAPWQPSNNVGFRLIIEE